MCRKSVIRAFFGVVVASYCALLSCCSGSQGRANSVAQVARDVVDCSSDEDLFSLDELARLVLTRTMGDWTLIRAELEPLGRRVGLCLGAAILRKREPSAVEGSSSKAEDAPLEPLKKQWGVRVVRTRFGDL